MILDFHIIIGILGMWILGNVKRHINLILGIRPDIIRSSLIIKNLKAQIGSSLNFVWTNQHYSSNMRDTFFSQLNLPNPDVTLNTDTKNDHSFISSTIKELSDLFSHKRPDANIFLGDTNTVLGSIASASMNIPVLHIEGCMRSYDWRMPEEKYRTTIDHLSDKIYAYLEEYKNQGIMEGIRADNIKVTGNPIVDILEYFFLSGKIRLNQRDLMALLRNVKLATSENFLVATCHRNENVTDIDSLRNIINLFNSLDERIIFIAGYKTQRKLSEFELTVGPNVTIINPIGYAEMLELLIRSKGVLTDSGTLVEEACILGVPSIQMRSSTERPQVYDVKASVKFDPRGKYTTTSLSLVIGEFHAIWNKSWHHPFGIGSASSIISDHIATLFNQKKFDGHVPDFKNPLTIRSHSN